MNDEDYYVPRIVETCIVRGRHMLPPCEGKYVAFVDPSGGSNDSMTLAIAYRQKQSAILAALLERKPPFSPDSVVCEFASTLRQYRISRVYGDRYAGEWPRERFRAHGIDYRISERSKAEIYAQFLPLLNSGRVELLDNPRLISQLCSLERRTSRGGRDSIDHPPGTHDDLINAAAGVLLAASEERGKFFAISVSGSAWEPGRSIFDESLNRVRS